LRESRLREKFHYTAFPTKNEGNYSISLLRAYSLVAMPRGVYTPTQQRGVWTDGQRVEAWRMPWTRLELLKHMVETDEIFVQTFVII
jgi:hypothetical protein